MDTVCVRSCVVPSVNVPVAVNCCVVPSATVADCGFMAIDTSVAVVTVSGWSSNRTRRCRHGSVPMLKLWASPAEVIVAVATCRSST